MKYFYVKYFYGKFYEEINVSNACDFMRGTKRKNFDLNVIMENVANVVEAYQQLCFIIDMVSLMVVLYLPMIPMTNSKT